MLWGNSVMQLRSRRSCEQLTQLTFRMLGLVLPNETMCSGLFAMGPLRQATGPLRSGAGVGVGMLRGIQKITWKDNRK